MIHNRITDEDRELYQLHTQAGTFTNSMPHVSSPPESPEETYLPGFITPPPTPCFGEEYPTPPPSRNDVFYSNCCPETEITTLTNENELPVAFDFLLDHPSAGPIFQNVDEAKAFLLGSIDEFYSRTECEGLASPLSNTKGSLLHVSNDDRTESNQTPPLEVVYDGPIFQSVDEAKEYILNAVHEFYSNENSGVCSMYEQATSCQLESQHSFGRSLNFIQQTAEFSF